VFANTHFIADVVGAKLGRMGFPVALLHKNITPEAREEAMVRISDGSAKVLVATDLASRGLDFPAVDCVVQFDLALDVSSYLHRAVSKPKPHLKP
jgi:superfamily II DNA/RNA helicase